MTFEAVGSRFPTDRLAIAWLLGSRPRYDDAANVVAVFEAAAQHVAAAPDVLAVGMAASGPLFGGYEPGEVTVAGQPDVGAGRRPRLRWIDVDSNYFSTLGLPMVAGRSFSTSDGRLMRPRFQILLVGIFAAIALALASVGVYGVISYRVAGGTDAFGLRMTMGCL